MYINFAFTDHLNPILSNRNAFILSNKIEPFFGIATNEGKVTVIGV